MDKDRELQLLHTLYGLMRVRGRYRYDADLVAVHQALPAEERDLVVASARELATSPEAAEAVGRGADQVLVEIACLTPGAMRRLASPALALRPNRGGFPPRRRLEAAGWLIRPWTTSPSAGRSSVTRQSENGCGNGSARFPPPTAPRPICWSGLPSSPRGSRPSTGS